MGKRWRAAIKPSLQTDWNARAGLDNCASRDRTFTRPTQQQFRLLLVRISNFQGAAPAWAVLAAPRGFVCSGTRQVTSPAGGQCQGGAGEAPGSAGFAELPTQLRALAGKAAPVPGTGCRLWPCVHLQRSRLKSSHSRMLGWGWHRGHRALCPSTDRAHRPLALTTLGWGYWTKSSHLNYCSWFTAFAGAGLAFSTKELQLDKEMPLTVPAVSRISSIHCWQSTSTCWGKRGTNSSEWIVCSGTGKRDLSSVCTCAQRALSRAAPALPQGWAALLLED